MTENENPDPDYLLQLPPAGKVKSGQTRMGSAADARKLANRVIYEDQARSLFRAIVKACYDGREPYSAKQLAENGGRWMANLNFGGLKALIDQARVPYYALFSGVRTYTDFYTGFERDNPDWQMWNDKVALHWTKMLDRWPQFHWHMQAMQFEMLFEGWGPVVWEDEIGWRFRSIPARNLLVPQKTESCMDHRVPAVVVRVAYRVHELYDKISDPAVAKDRGWQVEACRWAIRNSTKNVGGDNWQAAPWEQWEQRLKNHEICGSYTESDIIQCDHIFVQEFAVAGEEAKVSHFVVLEGTYGEAVDDKVGYLFEHPNRYDSYADAMVVSFQNTGDGTWHSVRGMGLAAYKHIEMLNRLMCTQINNAILAGMMILQPNDSQSSDRTQNIKFGNGVAWIPANTKWEQNRMSGDIQGPMAVQQMLTNNLSTNIGQFGGNTATRADGRGEKSTAREIDYLEGKETSLSQAQIDNHYIDLDQIYSNMFKRAKSGPDAESRRFIQDCLDDGVPQEALDQMDCVKANRLSGYPSPQQRKRNIAQMIQLAPSLPEDGKNAIFDEAISTFCGPEKVRVFNPKVQAPTRDTWDATVENDSLEDGINPPVISGMNNVVHLKIHLDYADEKLGPYHEAVDAGEAIDEATLQELYKYVSVLGMHAEEHLSKMQGDQMRKGAHELFGVQLKNLVAFHGKLRGAILDARRQAQQAQLEEQQANALGVKDQAELASMQAEQDRKDQIAVRDQGRKDQKTVAGQRLKTWQAQENQRLKSAQVASDITMKAAQTQADITAKRSKAKASPNGSKK